MKIKNVLLVFLIWSSPCSPMYYDAFGKTLIDEFIEYRASAQLMGFCDSDIDICGCSRFATLGLGEAEITVASVCIILCAFYFWIIKPELQIRKAETEKCMREQKILEIQQSNEPYLGKTLEIASYKHRYPDLFAENEGQLVMVITPNIYYDIHSMLVENTGLAVLRPQRFQLLKDFVEGVGNYFKSQEKFVAYFHCRDAYQACSTLTKLTEKSRDLYAVVVLHLQHPQDAIQRSHGLPLEVCVIDNTLAYEPTELVWHPPMAHSNLINMVRNGLTGYQYEIADETLRRAGMVLRRVGEGAHAQLIKHAIDAALVSYLQEHEDAVPQDPYHFYGVTDGSEFFLDEEISEEQHLENRRQHLEQETRERLVQQVVLKDDHMIYALETISRITLG